MYGNFSPRRGDTTPRLPPIGGPVGDQNSALALLEQSYSKQNTMQSINMEERRARIALEEQCRLLGNICKKLNQDIEVLDSQMGDKARSINDLELKSKDMEVSTGSQLRDLNSKISRFESLLRKIENEQMNMTNFLNNLDHSFNDYIRNINGKMIEVEGRISELNKKFDSAMSQQITTIKNIEGETRQFQSIDSRIKTMVDDLRSQVDSTKRKNEEDLDRLEKKLTTKIEDNRKNTDKFDWLERKLDEHIQDNNKKLSTFENDFNRSLSKVSQSTEKLEGKVSKSLEEKINRTISDQEKTKRDLNAGFRDLKDAIVSLQTMTDGKIRLSEDELKKEIDKIRKMAVLM